MKILVAVKRVIDYNVRIRIKADGTGIETSNVKMSMNPFDEIAVEAAIRLKEAGIATEVVIVSIGTALSQETLRHGLALGADSAILLQTEIEVQPLAVAKLLKKLVEQENPQLVILGKQAIDDDSNQTGQMLAGLLNWPQATFVSKIDVSANRLEAVREIDGGLETVAMNLPAVVTTDLRLNQPRYASLPNIVKAKSKPLTILQAEQLGVDIMPRLQILKLEPPISRKAGIKLETVAELVDKLKNDAQVL